MPRTNPRFHYRPGYCKHGVYVGGCGIDWMCAQCESMEPEPHWRDAYRWQRPRYTLTFPNGTKHAMNGARNIQPFYSILRRNYPLTVTKEAYTPNGWQTMYTRTFTPASAESMSAAKGA